MSKNTNLSFLADFLTADTVNTRVGINNASPQTTLDVAGTGKFSGVLTLGSTISNGTNTYTLPSATGTLALTSQIPANPVGGTGTTNTIPKFTGSTTIGNSLLTDNGTTLAYGNNIISVGASNTSEKYLEFGSSNGAYYVGGTSSEHYIFGQGDKPLRLYTNGTVKATLTSGGNLLVGTTTDTGFRLDVSGTGRFSDGTQGLIIRAYTAADGWGAIYPVGVTPSGTNYSLIARSTNVVLNASTSVTLAIGDSGKLTASSVGISVNGTAIISSGITSAGLVSSSTVRPSSNFAADLGTSSFRWADIFGFSLNVTGTSTSQQTNISADGAGVVLQGYVDNNLRIAVRGSGYNSGARGGLLASTGDFSSSVTSGFFGFNALASYGFTSYAGSSASGSSINFSTNYFGGYDAIYQSSGNTNDFGIWTNGGSNTQAKLYIKNNGNVLIGTATDNGARLQVSGNTFISGFTSNNLNNHGEKFISLSGPNSVHSFNVASEFPSLGIAGNVLGVTIIFTIFGSGGTVYSAIATIARNSGGSWSSYALTAVTSTASLLQSITGSGTTVTINTSAGSYVGVKVTVITQ